MCMFMVSLPAKRKEFVKVYFGGNLHRFLVHQIKPVRILLSRTWTWVWLLRLGWGFARGFFWIVQWRYHTHGKENFQVKLGRDHFLKFYAYVCVHTHVWLYIYIFGCLGLNCCMGCEILVPLPGIEPMSLALQGGFFITGLPVKSLEII